MPKQTPTQRVQHDARGLADQVRTSRFYDDLGVREWLRLDADVRMRVVFHVHRAILRRFICGGDRVLDAGCGAGRFSVEMTHLGATVIAGDISAVQVELARQSADSNGSPGDGGRVAQLSVSELPFKDESFDAAVCFGSVLSHLGRDAEMAAAELARVTKAGGLILLSVQSAHNYYLPYVLQQVEALGLRAVDEAILGGRELHDVRFIPWRQFSRDQLESLARGVGCEIVLVSASNVLAIVSEIPLLAEIEKDDRLWAAFLGWEEHLGQQPGNTERGAFTIAALRKQ